MTYEYSAFALLISVTAFHFFIGATKTGKEVEGPRFILEPPSMVIFTNDSGAMIHCSASGHPRPDIQWRTRDGSASNSVADLRSIYANGTLKLHPFHPQYYSADVHSTVYTCYASNMAGVIRSENVTVHAVTRQNYEVTVNDKDAIRGNTAVLKCEIPTFVKPYVVIDYWLRDQQKIEPGQKFGIFPTGELHIRNVSSADVATAYKCITKHTATGQSVASSRAGRLRLRDVVSLRPAIVDIKSRIRAKAGDTVELPCAAEGAPPPTYGWFRHHGGAPHLIRDTVHVTSGSLTLTSITLKSGGNYMCEARNWLGIARAATELVVTEPIKVVLKPRQQFIDAGKQAMLRCEFKGHPINMITWFKDGVLLTQESRIKHTMKTSVLSIPAFQREDKGMYQCFVSNEQETKEAIAELKLGVASPEIREGFKTSLLYPGGSISLQCLVSGNPLPDVTWFLDDTEVTTSSRYQLTHVEPGPGDVISTLNVSRVRVEEGGTYKCVARNQHGETSHSQHINIYGKPFVRHMKNVTAVANKKVVIQCYVCGYPIKQVTWEKDGILLPVNHRQHVTPDGTLVLENLDKDMDGGMYTCIARNPNGQEARRSVHVEVKVAPSIVPFSFPRLKQGARAFTMCGITGGDPPIAIRWEKDGRPIAKDLGVRIIYTSADLMSTLLIQAAQPQHNGNYTCIASNPAASVSHTAALIVDVPPSWIFEPRDTSVIIGSDVWIDCQATGTPHPSVEWRKKNPDLIGRDEQSYVELSDRRHRVFTNGTLRIINTTEDDYGSLLCQASNGVAPDLSKLIFLTVHVPATFHKKREHVTVRHGKTVSMDCKAKGEKPINIVWIVGESQRIDGSTRGRLKIEHYDTDKGAASKLTVDNTRREDSSKYTCVATNAYGHDSTIKQLKVLEKPEIPIDLAINGYSSRTVQISWKPPYDGNSPILAYYVLYKLVSSSWEDATELRLSPNVTILTLKDFHPAYTYELLVFAENAVGRSELSNTVIVTTEEEVPEAAPENVQCQPTGSQSLKLTWTPPAKESQNGKLTGYYVGYRLYNSSGPYLYHTVAYMGDEQQEYELTNLRKFTTYSLVVSAFNRRGTGPRSRDQVIRTLEDVPSSPPQNVKVVAINSHSLAVEWIPPPFENIHGIMQGYKVLYKAVPKDIYEDEELLFEVKETTGLAVTITGLRKYTNYSIQILAYTRAGNGVSSPRIYTRTLEDVPGPPAAIKAVSSSANSIVVSWLPPDNPNGKITQYGFYMKYQRNRNEVQRRVSLRASQHSHEVSKLETDREYVFWISAWTRVGEGSVSRFASASPANRVPARIVNFGRNVISVWKKSVLLSCETVAVPASKTHWKQGSDTIISSHNTILLRNGSLLLKSVQVKDSGKYSCTASNIFGTDSITYTLQVRAPPSPPKLETILTTSRSIIIKWNVVFNGGNRVTGGSIFYKKEFDGWQQKSATFDGTHNDTVLVDKLHCGTVYQFYMNLENKIGRSERSETISARTTGSTPKQPSNQKFVRLNTTYVSLNLSAWSDGGCPIKSFDVNYQLPADSAWKTVANNVRPTQKLFRIMDLQPTTAYAIRVTAHNEAGSTSATYTFSTLSHFGEDVIIDTEFSNENGTSSSSTVAPVVGTFVIILLIIIIIMICLRRRRLNQFPYTFKDESDSKDKAAEKALIAGLISKKLKESNSTGGADAAGARRGSTQSSRGWKPADLGDLESIVSPYATSNVFSSKSAGETTKDFLVTPSMDGNFYHNIAPPVPSRPERSSPFPFPVTEAATGCIQPNGGMNGKHQLMSYRKGPAPNQPGFRKGLPPVLPKPNLHSDNTSPYDNISGSTDDKKRRSLVSSVTTISSNYDELKLAYENFKLNPERISECDYAVPVDTPRPGIPIADTDSAESTDPGIVRFTQSPPKAHEQRESTCVLQTYNDVIVAAIHRKPSMSSDTTTDYDGRSPKEKSKRPKRAKSQTSVNTRQSGQSGKATSRRPTNNGSSSDDEVTSANSEEAQRTGGAPYAEDCATSPSLSALTCRERRVCPIIINTSGRTSSKQDFLDSSRIGLQASSDTDKDSGYRGYTPEFTVV